ncbi:MAG TPA: PPC domain-containing protein [Bryobacteraceae bacterium]|nr:PPC domain-containing protein [Bryobacteraceae bacterium]
MPVRIPLYALLTLAVSPLCADTVLPDLAPSVRSIFPLGAARGETVDIRILGRGLDRAASISFARRDIEARVLSADFFSISARLTVGPNVPFGLHEFRLQTPYGIHAGVFHVAGLPSLKEAEPNNDTDTAPPVTTPSVWDGVIDSGDYDCFRFHAEAGQTIILDLIATRAASPLDATLAVTDARGNELDFADDVYIHHDPYLSFTARETGDYIARVSGTGESGSKFSAYRLIIGRVPHVLRMLPAGVRRGAAQDITLYGLNLDLARHVEVAGVAGQIVDRAPERLTVRFQLPSRTATGQGTLIVDQLQGIPVMISDLEERVPTSVRSRGEPQPVRIPVAVTGTLDRRRARHFYRFHAAGGQRLAFEIQAMRLGYLLDPAIAIYDPEGRQIAFQDEPAPQNGKEPPQLDPYLVYTFEKAGVYTAMVRDSAERGDANYVYRLSIAPVEPDFEFTVRTPSLTLYRGQTNPLPVRVRRVGGWNMPVEIEAETPPAGITIEKSMAAPKNTPTKDTCGRDLWLDGTNVELVVKVARDAPLGVHPIRLRARGGPIQHPATVLFRWGAVGKITGPVEDQTLIATVADLPPLLLDPPEKLSITPGKPARLRVLVTRFGGAAAPLRIEPEFPVDGLSFENNELAAGATQVELRVTAAANAKPGSFRLKAGDAISPKIEVEIAKR